MDAALLNFIYLCLPVNQAHAMFVYGNNQLLREMRFSCLLYKVNGYIE